MKTTDLEYWDAAVTVLEESGLERTGGRRRVSSAELSVETPSFGELKAARVCYTTTLL